MVAQIKQGDHATWAITPHVYLMVFGGALADYLLFVPGYAALELVTSYAAPWLRHVRVSLGSLQNW